MSESPFTGAGQGFSEMAASCGDVAEQLMAARLQIIDTQQGKAAEAAVELIDGHISKLQALQENCTDMVSACQIQADADNAFSAAPTPADIEDQRRKTIAAARFGGVTQAQIEDKKLGELIAERDSARVRHAGETTATPPRFPTVEQSAGMRQGSGSHAGDGFDTGSETLMPLNRPSSGGGGGGGGMPSLPPMSMSDVGTHVSGDTAGAGAARAATTAPVPPQMSPMQMQPAGGTPSGMGAMPGGIPNLQAPQRKRDERGADVATGLSGDGAAAGSGLGAAAAVATGQPDRGGSVTGVRTIADVTGKGSGAVAATATNPNAGAGGGGGGGRPPMGGPMGGLGGGGALHQQNGKARPDVPNRNPDLVGQGTADEAVQGGLIGRESSGKPKPDFGGEPEPSNPERKAG